MALTIGKNKTGELVTVSVLNLGWLLKHAGEVTRLIWFDTKDCHDVDGLLVAHVGDKVYMTNYASRIVFDSWMLRNRCLRHVDVQYFYSY